MARSTASISRLTTERRKRWAEWVAEKAIMMTAMVAIISIILIFLFVGRKALPVLTNERIRQTANVEEFFTPNGQSPDGKPAFIWQPISERPKYSFIPLIVGTFKATVVAMLVAAPLALLCAIYTTEYAPRRLREYIKPAIELLAGVPSVHSRGRCQPGRSAIDRLRPVRRRLLHRDRGARD